MYEPTAYIADDNPVRADRLREILSEAGMQSVDVNSAADVQEQADVLFVAGDSPNGSGFASVIERFAVSAPDAPVLVSASLALWNLITMAIRKRAWMDVPRVNGQEDLLKRYAISRHPAPRIIIEGSVARCDELLNEWREASPEAPELVLVHTVGSALESAIQDERPVLLNYNIAPGGQSNGELSTLIYSLSPAVIAVLIEASNPRRGFDTFMHTDPASRFALLRPPLRSGEVRTLLDQMIVNWPATSPL